MFLLCSALHPRGRAQPRLSHHCSRGLRMRGERLQGGHPPRAKRGFIQVRRRELRGTSRDGRTDFPGTARTLQHIASQGHLGRSHRYYGRLAQYLPSHPPARAERQRPHTREDAPPLHPRVVSGKGRQDPPGDAGLRNHHRRHRGLLLRNRGRIPRHAEHLRRGGIRRRLHVQLFRTPGNPGFTQLSRRHPAGSENAPPERTHRPAEQAFPGEQPPGRGQDLRGTGRRSFEKRPVRTLRPDGIQ